jgi:hypothetical protein
MIEKRPNRQSGLADRAEDRPSRTPLGVRNILSYAEYKRDKNYSYRVINDRDDRVSRALAAGYEFVNGSSSELGDARVAEGTNLDSRISKPVGGGVTGYLMRIRKDFFEEDQAEKQRMVDKTEAAMKPKRGEDQYGSGLTTDRS